MLLFGNVIALYVRKALGDCRGQFRLMILRVFRLEQLLSSTRTNKHTAHTYTVFYGGNPGFNEGLVLGVDMLFLLLVLLIFLFRLQSTGMLQLSLFVGMLLKTEE